MIVLQARQQLICWAIAITALTLPAVVAACSDELVEFALPAGPLSETLISYGQQSGCSIVFDPQSAAGIKSRALSGTFSPQRALELLLENNDLEAKFISDSLIALSVRAEPPPPPAAPPPPAPPPRPIPPSSPELESIVVTGRAVTGSRIRGPDYVGFAQIDIIGPDDIELSGRQTVGEVLRFLPAVSGNSTSTAISNGGDGTATVTLRGLPAANTLVLLNGRRINTDGFSSKAVDLNSIPLAMVDHIEVLKDGASAIYGSDAVAGVVNLNTRRDVSGLHADFYLGEAERGDLTTKQINLVWGNIGDTWSTLLGASYYDQGTIWSRDRRVSETADDRPRGGTDSRSSATIPARFLLPDADGVGQALTLSGSATAGFPTGTNPAHFRPATDEDRFNFRDFTSAVVPSRRASLFAEARWDPSDDVGVWLEALVSRTTATNTLAPSPLLTAFERISLPIAADQPFNPFGIEITDMRRRISEAGERTSRNRALSQRFALGVEGRHRTGTWDAFVAFNQTKAVESSKGVLDAERIRLAIGPADACVSPCVPLNLFGPPGSISAQMLDYISLRVDSDGRSRTANAGANGVWEHGFGSRRLTLTAGYEYRHEALQTRPDPAVRAGTVIGFGNFGPTTGSRNVHEVYAEAFVPLLAEQPLAYSLDLLVAGRLSYYSDFGQTGNPKVSLRYRPTADLLLRTSVADGFRAPTLTQLFTATKQSFAFLDDPCSVAQNVGTLPGCTVQSDATLIQFLALEGGNVNLAPEESRSTTAGLVWTPKRWPGAQVSLDYYRIKQTNVVAVSPQFIVDQNARFGRFGERIQRDENGNIALVEATQLNIGRREVSGWDFSLQYHLPAYSWGHLQLAANATRISKFTDQLNPEAPREDHAGTFADEATAGNGALPTWKANLGLRYNHKDWELFYNFFYVSTLSETVPRIDEMRTIDAWRTHAVQLSYAGPFSGYGRIALGVTNLLDEDPPFAASAFNDSIDGRTYELAGRFAYLRYSRSF